MIGKIMKGAIFKRCVEYVMGKEKALLLDSEGLLTENTKSIINGFNTQRLLKSKIKQPVGHISLAYSVHDQHKLDDPAMIKLAREYMKEMGISDTQYIIVRHFDREHPHVHIVYNRIDNSGRTISDKNDHYRNEKVCKKLKEKHNLYFAKGKEQVKQHRLKGNDKTKYQIYNSIKDVLPKSRNWNEFETKLNQKGIQIHFKYKGNTDTVQGVSFSKDGITFKGSEIDRGFSYSKLDVLITFNHNQREKESIKPERNTEKHQQGFECNTGGLLDDLLKGNPVNEEFNPYQYKKKKKKTGLKR